MVKVLFYSSEFDIFTKYIEDKDLLEFVNSSGSIESFNCFISLYKKILSFHLVPISVTKKFLFIQQGYHLKEGQRNSQ